MQFDDYQRSAIETAIYPEAGSGSFNAVAYTVLGLSNEAGEVAGKLKKIWRDKDGVIDTDSATELVSEVGDVLWYMATLLNELDCDFSSVAEANLSKLRSRKERNALSGSGDNR